MRRMNIMWWLVTGAAAALSGAAAQALGVPGAWLVAALVVAVIAGLLRPDHPKVSLPFLSAAQAVIGTMLGSVFQPGVLPAITGHLPELAGILVVTIGVSLLSGLVIGRASPVSRESATLGTLPGGASAMISMSIDAGADTRTVALMQYLRVVIVVLSASLVARVLAGPALSNIPSGSAAPGSSAPALWPGYVLAPVVAIVGSWAGRKLRLPTGAFLGPIILALLCSAFNLFTPVWPAVVPQMAYVVIGFYVGFLFDKESLLQAGKLIPLMIANTVFLIAVCAATGLLFARIVGASPLTGYLATSPGGMDSIAIIAIGGGADISLVLSVQTLRLFTIVFTGPWIARAVIRHTRHRAAR